MNDVSADIRVLVSVGKGDIPAVAGQFDAADTKLDEVQGLESEGLNFGCYHPVVIGITVFISEARTILQESKNNLDDTGTALCAAAADYLEGDSQSRAKLEESYPDWEPEF